MHQKNTLTIIKPDDWHLHLRDNVILRSVLPHTITQFGRAIIMPNLINPIVTTNQAIAYRNRIIRFVPLKSKFNPLMTLYLTHHTSQKEILKAKDSGLIYGFKFYPAHATTNSKFGITDLFKCYKSLDLLQKIGMPLLVHGEVTDLSVDVFDREAVFIERFMHRLRQDMPALKIIFEHITTKDAVDYVMNAHEPIAATITAHHLLYNRNDMLIEKIQPHYYCAPILKREKHRQALLNAAISGNKRFFLGTDSAPHLKKLKENSFGCAGCYTSFHALELYITAFDNAGAIDKFEKFASFNGPDFYGLPRNFDKITLYRKTWIIPTELKIGPITLIPLSSGKSIHWKFDECSENM